MAVAAANHLKWGGRLFAVHVVFCTLQGSAVAGDKGTAPAELQFTIGEVTQLYGPTRAPTGTLLSTVFGPSPLPRPQVRLEIAPLLNGLVNFVQEVGVPVKALKDASAKHLVGISTSFRMREDMPAITFYARDSAPELFGAFYPAHRGVTWALVCPLDSFTLRLQGGADSEFGSFAIAGLEWQRQTRPLAIGIGVPLSLHSANRAVGAIVQLRMKFD